MFIFRIITITHKFWFIHRIVVGSIFVPTNPKAIYFGIPFLLLGFMSTGILFIIYFPVMWRDVIFVITYPVRWGVVYLHCSYISRCIQLSVLSPWSFTFCVPISQMTGIIYVYLEPFRHLLRVCESQGIMFVCSSLLLAWYSSSIQRI